MDMISALGGIGAAFGLSAGAGLNAYIPLLVVALTARFTDLLNLSEPYDVLTNPFVIAVLAVLLVIEVLVDKIPAVDSLNDIIQTFVRPAAGAIMFAANANVVTDLNPAIAVTAGILMAGSVHATKSTIRPAITAGSVGTGNWFVSIVEDVISFVAAILAIFAPLLIGAITLVAMFFIIRLLVRRRRKRSLQTL